MYTVTQKNKATFDFPVRAVQHSQSVFWSYGIKGDLNQGLVLLPASLPGLLLLSGPKMGQLTLLYPVPSAPPCQISRLLEQKCDNTAPKLSNFGILPTNLPLRADSFAQFSRNSQRLYTSIPVAYFLYFYCAKLLKVNQEIVKDMSNQRKCRHCFGPPCNSVIIKKMLQKWTTDCVGVAPLPTFPQSTAKFTLTVVGIQGGPN